MLKYIITRVDNGWIGEVVCDEDTSLLIVAHEDDDFSASDSEALKNIFYELFFDYSRSKHKGGLEIIYHEHGRDHVIEEQYDDNE